jgi:hypothetical protein
MRTNIIKFALISMLLTVPCSFAIAANGPVEVGKITINVVDPDPTIGFSDPTEVLPIDGNPGVTVGEQRLEAYKHVAVIWGDALDINTQIVIQAAFTDLNCTLTSGTLGAAGAINAFRDFPGPSFPSTWYAGALANNLAGTDQNGSDPDPGLLSPPYNDEIVSFFNANLGNEGCLENSGWYYGFSNSPGPGEIDFIEVLTHEVGHGLGFQNFTNDETGANYAGYPDQWSRFLGDNVLGKNWSQMVDFERAFSATNGPNLVWNGPNVWLEAPNVLGPAPVILVTAGTNAGEEMPFGTASFGPELPPEGIQGPVELVDDADDEAGEGTTTDGCQPLVNFTSGNIALIDRGACAFSLKALNADAAGASAVIIANNTPGDPPGMSGDDEPTITTVSVTQDGGAILREDPKTEVDIGIEASGGPISGVDYAGRPKMYAPYPAQPGSSVSHFDTSAYPNVLMEPFSTNDVDVNNGDVDLTDDLLFDIGWDGNVTCPINAHWYDETLMVLGCDSGVENRRGEYVVIPSKAWLPGKHGATAGGCYLADVIDSCFPVITINGQLGQYRSCLAQVTSDLKQQGNLSKDEAGRIMSCAGSGKGK